MRKITFLTILVLAISAHSENVVLPIQCANPVSPTVYAGLADRLASIIGKSIETTTPYARAIIPGSQVDPQLPRNGCFENSYDWHSSVSAHWALLVTSRLFHRPIADKAIQHLFDSDCLEAEARFLTQYPKVELPYGQSWLLLLLTEMEKHGDNKYSKLKNQLSDRLFTWFETHKVDCEGQHESWLPAFLIFSLDTSVNSSDRFFLLKYKMFRIKCDHDTSDARIPEGIWHSSFMSPMGILSYFHEDGINPSLEEESRKVFAPHTKPDLHDVHEMGRLLSLSWSTANKSSQGDQKACFIYRNFLNQILVRPSNWAEQFEHLAHWLPQFIWLSAWLEMGTP